MKDYTKRQRGQALAHVLYEIDMMLAVFDHLYRISEPPGIRRNAFLESLIVHLRCLDEFFNDPKKADIYITPTWIGYEVGAPKKSRHSKIGRMNAEICHLGFDRKKGGQEGEWPLVETCLPIVRLCVGQRHSFPSSDDNGTQHKGRGATGERA